MSIPPGLNEIVESVIDLKKALEALPSSSRLSGTDAEALYALAYQLMSQGRHDTAFRYFSLLTLYKPTQPKYLRGLALANRMLERYDEALNVYAFLAVIDPMEPQHSLDMAECMLLRRDLEEARQTVEMVLRYCKKNSLNPEAQERAEAMIGLMDHSGAAAA